MPWRRTPSAARKVTSSEEQAAPVAMREAGACASDQAAHRRSVACKNNLRSADIANAPEELGLGLGHNTGLLQLGFKFSQARVEGLIPLPARGDILHGSGYAQYLTAGIFEQHDVEFDGDSAAVLGERGNGKHAVAVLGDPGCHDPVVALPVPRAVLLGDDHVHGLADGLAGSPAEHGLGARIPQLDDALPIAKYNGDGTLIHNAFAERLVSEDVSHRQLQ